MLWLTPCCYMLVHHMRVAELFVAVLLSVAFSDDG